MAPVSPRQKSARSLPSISVRRLPEALATFASRSDLERLFLCVADEDAAFAGQKPEALRPYMGGLERIA